MRRFRGILTAFLITLLLTTLLAGCGGGGGGGGGEAAPPAPQTGDISLFQNSQLLVSAQDLAQELETPGTIVLDARHSDLTYSSGHIPGAIHASPDYFSTSNHILRPDAELVILLGGLGITSTSRIIIYDDTVDSLGAAGRLFWMLEYLGCTNVSVLNGGWDQWLIQRMPAEKTTPAPLPAAVFTAQVNNPIYVTRETVSASLLDPADPNFRPLTLVDVRTNDEYHGLVTNGAARPGYIPGAINFPYPGCYNPDKTILSHDALAKLLQSLGITKDTGAVVAYSTVGKRSAFLYFLTRLMGYSNVANYDGSIMEWASLDPASYPMIDDTP